MSLLSDSWLGFARIPVDYQSPAEGDGARVECRKYNVRKGFTEKSDLGLTGCRIELHAIDLYDRTT